jgi:large repetitive protein
VLLPFVGLLLALFPALAGGTEPGKLPDPLESGPYAVERLDPFRAGLATLQEPSSTGGAATGSNESITLQIRGVMYMPHNKSGRSPLIILVHGNHGSCDEGTAPQCTIFKRNDEGYAYLGENLASWGYTVLSLDQDQLISRQDSKLGKGMHARRLLIMALLDALHEADETGLPENENSNIGDKLKGKLDFTRIGLMGHSRGGDAVSSFIEYNRMRPTGRRYPLRGVISLAPVDYERHAPYGVPYMSVFGSCDGDVSNLQGARLFERSQYIKDPYPRVQSEQLGGDHNWYNTVWFADADDASAPDNACHTEDPGKTSQTPHSIRLSGEAGTGPGENYVINNSEKLNPEVNTRISGSPARMGDQEKLGLAMMSAFLRRYVGGEGAMEPYLTGELIHEEKPEIPTSACPTSTSGTRVPCIDRVSNTFFSPPGERLDVIRPDTQHPLTESALGTALTGSGFSNPFVPEGGVTPMPPTTAVGFDWCNPDPLQTEPIQLGISGNPTAAKPCPLPAAGALGGQNGTREHSPVNGSYGRQLSLAWEEPVEKTSAPATLATAIPATNGNISGYKQLAMGAAVNFFDSRNPARGAEGEWNPEAAKQDFTIALTDAEGHVATVKAGDHRYGNALEQTLGSTTPRVHVILNEIGVPLEDFAKQGLNLKKVRKLEFRFGSAGMPQSGSIQLADVRFQESIHGANVLLDSTTPNAGPAEGPPTSGPNPIAELESFPRAPGSIQLPTVTTDPGSNTWTVGSKADCPNAEFAKIQEAIEYAAPWDTIVVCPGVYEESSTPVNSLVSPVQAGAMNGLTINKPLKIVGAGADKVKIRPAASLGASLAGTQPYLRDGGGNVVTVSRQSLGSTDFVENFVDISGVTIESPNAYAEAGVSFFNTSGRVSDSVIGPIKRATSSEELAAKPYGWGVVASNSLIGTGLGSVERQVTVADSLVTGYQAGGILFDGARGADGAPSTEEPSNVNEKGYVTGTFVHGQGPDNLIPQNGVEYHAGAGGFVEHSNITGNLFSADKRRSVGILLAGADTGGSHVSKSALSGNGYGVYNANIANTALSSGPPLIATDNFWGSGGRPEEGESTGSGEGVSGGGSVTYVPVLPRTPSIAPAPGIVPDLPPSGSIVSPVDGEAKHGSTVSVVVAAGDDFGVKSVTLTANGTTVGTASEAPYVFSWTVPPGSGSENVTLGATITDSSGQSKTAVKHLLVK